MHICFVSTSRGSPFMTELLQAVSDAAAAAGHPVELVCDAFPPLRADGVYVVIPHEFLAWGDPGGFPDRSQRARTIALCTENPGTPWFEDTRALLPELAAAASINLSSAQELRRRGIPCEHIQLGYSPAWDSWGGLEHPRPIDVLYLAAADPRRDPLLAGIGTELWHRRCEFLVPPLEPRTAPRPDFILGAQKYQRLRSAKILLNLHRTTSRAFEWMRFLEAICNGCVVVSEPCLDSEPLIVGEHFLTAEVDALAQLADGLLNDPQELAGIRSRSYAFVKESLSMKAAVERLVVLASTLPREPQRPDASMLASRSSPPSPGAAGRAPDISPPRTGRSLTGWPDGLLRTLQLYAAGGTWPVRHRRPWVSSRSFARAQPEISLLWVPDRDGGGGLGRVIADTSALQFDRPHELLVAATAEFEEECLACAREASLPVGVFAEPAGSPRAALNRLLVRARAELVLVLDDARGLYPSAPARLAARLEDDAGATFAYPMAARLDGARVVGLAGSLPWEPARLRTGDYVGPVALIRRRQLVRLGGFSTDPRLAGWEFFDLWCSCAETGHHGVHMPQVLAWRGSSEGEVTPAAWQLLRQRHPRLLGVTPTPS